MLLRVALPSFKVAGEFHSLPVLTRAAEGSSPSENWEALATQLECPNILRMQPGHSLRLLFLSEAQSLGRIELSLMTEHLTSGFKGPP